MKITVIGGVGFVGSHIAEFYSKEEITIFDNLSRANLLMKEEKNVEYNWSYLKKYKNISFIKGDIRNKNEIFSALENTDVIFHMAAQTAVTTSLAEPELDFFTNALGTFNVLEAARKSNKNPVVIYASTNKVYGNNVNSIGIKEGKENYSFEDKFKKGIQESFPIDLCEHTPYGCSKLTGDLYAQDYARLYGLKTGVFRMSCIYGTRQFGVEDQGWIAWFTIATILGKPLTLYGDGKQVRDVLYVTDLIELYDKFLHSKLKHGVFNAGGGYKNTLSLLQLLDLLEEFTGKRSEISYGNWRPSDQKVFISDITKAKEVLGWKPKTSPEKGVKKLVEWVSKNIDIF